MSSVKNDLYILAGAIQDAIGPPARPGAIHWRDGRIIASGPPEAVPCPGGATVIERPGHLILPGLVNAHAHLDLTGIGPMPYCGDFIEWIQMVMASRPIGREAIEAAVRLGIEKSIAGGTAIIGDIAGVGSTVPLETLRADGRLHGVSFVEFFGLGSRQQQAIEAMERACTEFPVDRNHRVQLGLQPHAPYSAGLNVYKAAIRLTESRGVPFSTHLAETEAEIEFARTATGPFADFLRRIDRWDESIEPLGQHPLEAIADLFTKPVRWLAVHMNHVDVDQRLQFLPELRGMSIVHCPRATAYFGRAPYRFPPEPVWRRFALGTDSAINLDRTDRISILDEVSLLHRRDRIGAVALLACATIGGAASLGFDWDLVTLQPGPCAGLIAVEFDPNDPADALVQVLHEPGPIEWVVQAW